MKVLVTGGAGYLGSLLVPMLLQRGDEVTVLDQFRWGFQPMLAIAAHPRLRIEHADVRDSRRLTAAMAGRDAIVNLAAIVGFPACARDPLDARTINQDAVAAIAAALQPGQMLIQASTGSTYGQVDGVCDEDTPINPLTLYGETKAAAEAPVLDRGGVPLRFATVFGVSPRMRLDLLVNDIVYQVTHMRNFVMFEGHARRTFLHSTDAARSVMFALDNYSKMSGQPFNVGDEALNFTKQQIAELVKQKKDYYLHNAEFGEDKDKRDYEVSYARIKALGFSAQVGMGDGIDELLRVMPFLRETSVMRNI
jgi:nucleoside-diphosphate-sugar epimerase